MHKRHGPLPPVFVCQFFRSLRRGTKALVEVLADNKVNPVSSNSLGCVVAFRSSSFSLPTFGYTDSVRLFLLSGAASYVSEGDTSLCRMARAGIRQVALGFRSGLLHSVQERTLFTFVTASRVLPLYLTSTSVCEFEYTGDLPFLSIRIPAAWRSQHLGRSKKDSSLSTF